MCIIGRSTGYRPDYCKLAHNYCRLGATNAQLAEFFEVPPATIDSWLATIPEFADEVRRGSRLADAEVAHNLHRLATGYHHQVERVMMCRGKPLTVTYTRHYPPHFGACKHWLEVRCPEKWSLRRKPIAEMLDDLIREQAVRRLAALEAVRADLAELHTETSAERAGSAETSKNPAEWPSKRPSDFHAETCPNLPKPLPARELACEPANAGGPAERAKRAESRENAGKPASDGPAIPGQKVSEKAKSPRANLPALLSDDSDASHDEICTLGQRPVIAIQPLVASREFHESRGHALSGFS